VNRFRRKAQDPKNKTVETPKDIQLLSDLTELIREQRINFLKMEQKNPDLINLLDRSPLFLGFAYQAVFKSVRIFI